MNVLTVTFVLWLFLVAVKLMFDILSDLLDGHKKRRSAKAEIEKHIAEFRAFWGIDHKPWAGSLRKNAHGVHRRKRFR